ncbi:MAG: hypothetical protein JW934_06905 [Anaerolineae bacterium]|nr:hypothetical protein [Anaerolineae bacterium]
MQTDLCDRACLQAFVDNYLAAMVAHDPSRLPLAETVKYTEDTATIPIGDGLWVGASEGPTTFKIYALDVVAGQAGFFGVLKEFGRPVLLALRLKIVGQKITEIEHVVARFLNESAMANLVEPRSGFVQPVSPAERVSRKDMLRIADSYFDSIEQCNGDVAPFAGDSVRHENGKQTTTNKPPNPASFGPSESEQVRLAMARIDALGVRDQMSCRNLSYITRIRPRRLIIVDEELGLVYGFPVFVHRGNVRTIKIVGVPGVDTIPIPFGPINLQAGEIFKISGGQIHEIEANGCLLPYGVKSGWEDEYGSEITA